MNILSVDDKRENLYYLETLLRGSGYEVVSAENGAEALEILRTQSCDLIIADILMPVMDGFQLCRTVKAEKDLRHIPLVFYTATYTDEKDEQFALGIGADRFLRKPMEPQDLLLVIQNIVNGIEHTSNQRQTPILDEEAEVFKLYNERLVQKLEKKMLDLDREITERERAEEEIRLAHDQLRKLSQQLERTAEEERKRLARELHDEFGQALTGLKFDIAWIKRRVGIISNLEALTNIQERLDTMNALVNHAIHSVQRIATSLRPSLLDDLGLIPALEWQTQDFQDRTGLRCTLSVNSQIAEREFDASTATALFRITQEILTNVIRHAQASTVALNLEENTEWMTLEATDDGMGIDMAQMRQHGSLGLLGIQERVQQLSGICTIHGNAQGGTTISVRIPVVMT